MDLAAPGSRTSPGSPECSPTLLRRQHTFSDSGLSLPPAATDREPSLATVSTALGGSGGGAGGVGSDVLALIQSQGGFTAGSVASLNAEGSTASLGRVKKRLGGGGMALNLGSIGEALGTLGEVDLSAGVPMEGFDSPVALTSSIEGRGGMQEVTLHFGCFPNDGTVVSATLAPSTYLVC